jgi:hypothetical protein
MGKLNSNIPQSKMMMGRNDMNDTAVIVGNTMISKTLKFMTSNADYDD